MVKDTIMEYITGTMIDPKSYKKFLLSSGCFAMLGILVGFLLKSYWLYIGIIMFSVYCFCMCLAFVIISKELTLKRKIKIQALIYVSWYLQIGLLSTIIFTHTYGVNYKLLLLFLPSFLLCLFMFVATSIMIKNGKFTTKRDATTKGLGGTMITVVGGWTIGFFLDNQSTRDITVPILLVCLTIINTFLSIGFLNFQKLYYLEKMTQEDGFTAS